MNIKIAYIGGGSKAWALKFMQDLALAPDLTGEVALYDIDLLDAGLAARDREMVFNSFLNQPLCGGIAVEEARELFGKMCDNVRDEEFPF